MPLRVLVTAVGSAIAQGIIKSLNDSSLEVEIITTDTQPYAAGLYRGAAGYIVPKASSPEYIGALISICRDERVQAILVGTDYELGVIANHKDRIRDECGALAITSSPEVVRIADDKWLTHQFLEENGFPTIPSVLADQVERLIAAEGFPLIIKPRVGDSSKDTFIVRNERELEERLRYFAEGGENTYLQASPKPIIQKYMGSEATEYTSSVVVLDGVVKGVITMNREMKFPGHTTKAVVRDFPDIDRVLRDVATRLQPFGPCNFQSRYADGKSYIFEINCRFSGTTGICSLAGFNHVEACLRSAILGEEVAELSAKPGVFVRYFDEMYIPMDELETMVRNGKVKNSCSETHASL
jgi:carbamoyl-phosphate synthase large subunit